VTSGVTELDAGDDCIDRHWVRDVWIDPGQRVEAGVGHDESGIRPALETPPDVGYKLFKALEVEAREDRLPPSGMRVTFQQRPALIMRPLENQAPATVGQLDAVDTAAGEVGWLNLVPAPDMKDRPTSRGVGVSKEKGRFFVAIFIRAEMPPDLFLKTRRKGDRGVSHR
jgi:hypothetical protein